jgi:hypothetical protein
MIMCALSTIFTPSLYLIKIALSTYTGNKNPYATKGAVVLMKTPSADEKKS